MYDSLIPPDKSFTNFIKNIDKRVSASERARQIDFGDWREYNLSLFTYVSDNLVELDSEIILTDNFQVGDKVKVIQDSTDKYFYIIKVDSATNRLTLDAGSVHTFTNDAYTYFAISKMASPLGHPLVFDYTDDVVITDGTSDLTAIFSDGTAKNTQYAMSGNIVQIWLELSTFDLPTGVNSILVSTPFLHRPEMASSIKNTNHLLAGAETSIGDIHTLYAWQDWTDSVGTFPSEAGIEISPLILGGEFDELAWWWVGNLTVTV